MYQCPLYIEVILYSEDPFLEAILLDLIEISARQRETEKPVSQDNNGLKISHTGRFIPSALALINIAPRYKLYTIILSI